MAPFDWDPDAYLQLMAEEVPDYGLLQEVATAATGDHASRVLELGTGTGETAKRVLARHPGAFLVGVDGSREMLARARQALPADRVQLLIGRLEDQLPAGPFDVVISALAIHHLDGAGKADLFRRVAAVVSPGGRFVLGDLVIPDDPSDAVTPIDAGYDMPSSVADQQRWLQAAGFSSHIEWTRRDLAVILAEAPSEG